MECEENVNNTRSFRQISTMSERERGGGERERMDVSEGVSGPNKTPLLSWALEA